MSNSQSRKELQSVVVNLWRRKCKKKKCCKFFFIHRNKSCENTFTAAWFTIKTLRLGKSIINAGNLFNIVVVVVVISSSLKCKFIKTYANKSQTRFLEPLKVIKMPQPQLKQFPQTTAVYTLDKYA